MTEPKRPYPDGVPVAPDTTMPPRKFVRWGATADSPPTDIHDDPDKTRAYLAGLTAGRAEAAADFDRLRDERDRYREALEGIVALHDTPVPRIEDALPDDVAMAEAVQIARSALAVFDTLTEEKT